MSKAWLENNSQRTPLPPRDFPVATMFRNVRSGLGVFATRSTSESTILEKWYRQFLDERAAICSWAHSSSICWALKGKDNSVQVPPCADKSFAPVGKGQGKRIDWASRDSIGLEPKACSNHREAKSGSSQTCTSRRLAFSNASWSADKKASCNGTDFAVPLDGDNPLRIAIRTIESIAIKPSSAPDGEPSAPRSLPSPAPK